MAISYRRSTTAPDPAWGAYSAPPDPLAGFEGPTSKGREGRGEEERGGREGMGMGRGMGRGAGRTGRGWERGGERSRG